MSDPLSPLERAILNTNIPPCPHWLHDIEDYDDPSPTCCVDDCTCGRKT